MNFWRRCHPYLARIVLLNNSMSLRPSLPACFGWHRVDQCSQWIFVSKHVPFIILKEKLFKLSAEDSSQTFLMILISKTQQICWTLVFWEEENGCLSALPYYLLNVSTNFSQFWAVAWQNDSELSARKTWMGLDSLLAAIPLTSPSISACLNS